MLKFLSSTLLGVALLPGAAFAQEKITLNWALWDWPSGVFYKPLIDAYEAKNPNIDIEYTDLGSTDYNQMVMMQLTGGSSGIDIVTIKDIPNYAQLISANALADIGKTDAAPADPAVFGGLIEELTVDGGLYGLPFRTDLWIMYYNKDHFDAAGLDYPTNDLTWPQFDALARKLTSGFGAKKVYGAHNHTWRSIVQLPGILDGENGFVQEDYSFLTPWYERALALQSEGVVQNYGSLKASNTHYSGAFFSGQIAMMPMGTWFIGTQIAKIASGESLSTNWGVARFPVPEGVEPGVTAASVTSLGVSRNSAHQQAALDFIAWASGPEGAAVTAATGTIPAIRNAEVVAAIAAMEGFPQDETSAGALVTTRTYLDNPVDLNLGRVDQVLARAHDSIMTNNVSIAEGIAEMNAGVRAVLAK